MIHHHTTLEPGDHYAVGTSANGAVLAQLQHVRSSGIGDQVRVMLTPEEARHLAQLLLEVAERASQR
jgi:hypothetical protein